MNFKETFLKLTEYTIPFGHEGELEHLLPSGWKKDSVGNYYYQIGTSETLFTSHLDVATDQKTKINHIISGNIIKTDGTTILGGDNKAGCCVLFYLIENFVPGTYYFFLGEETAVHKDLPHGSLLAIESNPEFFKRFKRAISFDRKEKGQLVTRQLGRNCCSDEFADSLIKEFGESGIEYSKDRTGYYTDVAFFGDLIPEIVNLSAGVYNEHTVNEYVDIKYVESVAKAAAKINWEKLPTIRTIDKTYQTDSRLETEEIQLSNDQKIFQEVFTILDNLYYVCQEIRSYKNYLYHFKPGRKYHFTKWHDDEELEISVQDGVIHMNDSVFNKIEDFKKYFGIEKLNRHDFYNLIMSEFDKNGGKLTDAQFDFLTYQKGANLNKFDADLKKNRKKLQKIGKGYQIVKESFLMSYTLFKESIHNEKIFEKLLDSLIDILEDFGFIEYNEGEGEWCPPETDPYYEFSYNQDGSIRQINICNVRFSKGQNGQFYYPLKLMNRLENAKNKIENRINTNISIIYSLEEDFIRIFPVKK